MIESMTGFGRCERTDEHGTVLVEVRSVNGRFLKVQTRLPDLLLGREAEVERLVKARLNRGSVSVAMHLKTTESASPWQINTDVLAAYVKALIKVRDKERMPKTETMRLELVAALPGVVEPAAAMNLAGRLWPLAAAALDEALTDLLRMRRAEGEALAAVLAAHVDEIERSVGRLVALAPGVVAGYRARLQARVQDLLAQTGVSVSEADLIREVAVFAERSDIAEELNRLKSHVDQFRTVLAGAGGACEGAPGASPKDSGRTLEFITQEMQREANTVSAKANDAALAREVVALKGEIDRLKEQIQNVT
jgi:uncharacterized protein (TIGR00255 family)